MRELNSGPAEVCNLPEEIPMIERVTWGELEPIFSLAGPEWCVGHWRANATPFSGIGFFQFRGRHVHGFLLPGGRRRGEANPSIPSHPALALAGCRDRRRNSGSTGHRPPLGHRDDSVIVPASPRFPDGPFRCRHRRGPLPVRPKKRSQGTEYLRPNQSPCLLPLPNLIPGLLRLRSLRLLPTPNLLIFPLDDQRLLRSPLAWRSATRPRRSMVPTWMAKAFG